jgi:hypothetical protein
VKRRKILKRVVRRIALWHRIEPRVRGILCFVAERDDYHAIHPLTRLTALGVNSKDRRDLAVILDSQFGIVVPRRVTRNSQTYADLVSGVVSAIDNRRSR